MPAEWDDQPHMVEKHRGLDEAVPDWRTRLHDNGQRMFADNGTMLDELGNRSIFDDIDE